MPLTSLTCPNCKVTLKPKTPVPEGTRLKCPKCAAMFVAGGAAAPASKPAAPKPASPKPAAPKPKPKPAPAEEEEVEGVAEVIDDDEEVVLLEADDEEEGEKKPARKRMPTWAWVAIGGGALFLVCCGCGGPIGYVAMYGFPGAGGVVTKANYDKIKKEMTEAQVKAILGEPSMTGEVAGTKSDTWKNSDDYITVHFDGDKALSGSYEFSGLWGKQTGGGPLP
jgi:hypothetical protein